MCQKRSISWVINKQMEGNITRMHFSNAGLEKIKRIITSIGMGMRKMTVFSD